MPNKMRELERDEVIKRWEMVLVARPKYLLTEITGRNFEDRASYHGSELSNFLDSENGEMTRAFLRKLGIRINITISEYPPIFFDASGLKAGDDDCWMFVAAYDAIAAILRAKPTDDPVNYIITRLIEIAGDKRSIFKLKF